MQVNSFFSLLFTSCCLPLAAQNHTPPEDTCPKNITRLLIDENQQTTENLQSLLALDQLSAKTLKTAKEVTQENWIGVRQGLNGIERRDLNDSPARLAIKQQVIDIANRMNLLQEQKPLHLHYNYALCLGGFIEGVRMRLAVLAEAWKNGVRFDSLIFLGSDRLLRNKPGENEAIEILMDSNNGILPIREDWTLDLAQLNYATENDMHKLLWQQADLPKGMREHLEGRVVFIDARSEIPGKRACTGDTYTTWFRDHRPLPGTILAASSPLIWPYQHLVGIKCLGSDYPLDTISFALRGNLKVSLLFDTLAKCLYEISEIENTDRDRNSNWLHNTKFTQNPVSGTGTVSVTKA